MQQVGKDKYLVQKQITLLRFKTGKNSEALISSIL
jgi:hypothetical protein